MKFTFKILREVVSKINRDEFGEPDIYVTSWKSAQTGLPSEEPEALDAMLDAFTLPTTNGEPTTFMPTQEGVWLSHLCQQIDLQLLRQRIEKGETSGQGILFHPSKWPLRLRPTPPSQEECTAVAHRALKAVIRPVRDFVFMKNGDYWDIVYGGLPFPHIKHEIGLDYISHLLSNRGSHFTPRQLETAVRKFPSESDPDTAYSDMSEKQLRIEGLSTQGLKARENSDDTAIKNYHRRLKEVEEEITQAKQKHDQAQMGKLTNEREWLLKELRGASALAGKGEWDYENETARKRISAAIHRAIEAIEVSQNDLPGGGFLAQHLRSNLTPISFPYGYSPDRPIDWIT